jgi:hypothetical protein
MTTVRHCEAATKKKFHQRRHFLTPGPSPQVERGEVTLRIMDQLFPHPRPLSACKEGASRSEAGEATCLLSSFPVIRCKLLFQPPGSL